MKILGHTPEGDLIIQVSQVEWDGLQKGVKPEDDLSRSLETWKETEAEKVIGSMKGLGCRYYIHLAYIEGKFDGTLEGLNRLMDTRIRNMGEGSRKRIRQAILDYKAAQAAEPPDLPQKTTDTTM